MNGGALSFKRCGVTLRNRPKASVITCRATSLEMGSKRNLYKILALDSEFVGPDEIKKAYRNMARQYHPDVCDPSIKEESTMMFVELRRAYETLSNPDLRRRHDLQMQIRDSESTVGMEYFSKDVWKTQLNELRQRSDRSEKAGSRRAWT